MNYQNLDVIPGRPYPMGPVVYPDGIRFTLFSRHARRVWLALFKNVEDLTPVWEYELDPARHRIGDVWSIFVRGLEEGALFKYRVDGPFDPAKGHRYNRDIYLLDPYAKAFVGDVHDGTMKCVAVHDRMDWTDDIRPKIPFQDLVIYETHVKGFTRHPSSGVGCPGTYAGFIEKIPWLKELGINAVELLPIHEMGENYIGRKGPDGQELTNYWGYSTIGFFAPTGRYAVSAKGVEHLDEFRSLVRELHRAGIEIILDVVFNHTSEGNELGPTLCFKGIDNAVYYLLRDGQYLNFSGCGNTMNCNHPIVLDFILDCLRYWVAVMHIDGFRFDLASILGRGQDGSIRQDAPLLTRIAEDLRLALEAAGRAEKRAKESGRNAWQIEIMRRSGDHSALLCLWPDVQDCVELMRAFDKGASDRWTYRLRALAPTLSALPQEAVQAEIKRQVNRGEEESRRLLGEDKERSAGEIMAEKYAGFMKRREKRETHGLAEFVTFCQSAGFLVRGRDR